MSAERDAGFAALQNGNAAEAIPYLERAVSSAPDDFQALLQLGAAYGQVGRHADSVRTVMQAVTLQPSNAAARYNLALAYANAGHKEYALTAAQQALQLQPDNPQSRELVARLSGVPTAPVSTVMGSMPTGQSPAPAAYGEPTRSLSEQPAQPTIYGQPAAPTPYGQTPMPPAQSQPPYGQAAPAYGQASPPYGAPGGVPPQAGPGSYQGQGAAAYGGSPLATTYAPPSRAGYAQPPDKFDMKQALTDWVRVIREPNAFFREQAERTGYNAPLAFLLTFGIAGGILVIFSATLGLLFGHASILYALGQIIGGATSSIIGVFAGAFVWGGVLHLVGRMFGNRQPYHKSFRVAAYARAPLLFSTALTAIITPFVLPPSALQPSSNASSPFGQITRIQFTEPSTRSGFPGGTTDSGSSRAGTTNPFEQPAFQKLISAYVIIGPISILGLIWAWCLQSIGLRYAQDLSPGSAAGTVFVAVATPTVILGVLAFLVGMLLASLTGAARGTPGFQNMLSMLPPGPAVWRGL